MKRIVLAILGFMALLTSQETFAQIGMGTETPDKSAVLDLVSTRRGLLIPRISIPDLNVAAPVAAPVTSLLVYNEPKNGATTKPGFYYWDGAKWVAITSDSNQLTSSVVAGDGVTVSDQTTGNNTAYTVGITPGAEGQYLVTYDDAGDLKTKWIDLPDLLTDLVAINGLTYDPNTHTLKLGGDLEEGTTTIGTAANKNLAITGLQTGANTDEIVVMGDDGILKKISRAEMLAAKNLSLEAGVLEFTTGNGVNAVLVETSIGIIDKGIASGKLTPGADGEVLFTEGTDAVWESLETLVKARETLTELKYIAGTNSLTYKDEEENTHTLNLNNTSLSYDQATQELTYVNSKGETSSINLGELVNSNITKADLTTDGKIVVGENTSDVTTSTNAVLEATKLSIKKGAIDTEELADNAVTTAKIENGAVTKEKIQGEGNTQVLTTSSTGVVAWTDQSALANKDSYTGVGAVSVTENGTSAAGINYDVSVATAHETTLGVVKEAAAIPTVDINDGVLSVNRTNTIVEGDVTGPLNATKVVAIQNVGVDATAPTNDQVLQYNGTTWKATSLDASAITGEQLKSDGSITISNDTNKALLEELDIKITPGTTKDQVLVTNDDADGTGWKTVNEIVEVANGLHKDDTTNEIHLGGALVDETTTITTAADKKLAVAGLQSAEKANQYVVAEDATGVLRTVAKSISGTIPTIANIDGYSPHVPEVHVAITLPNTGDVNMVFPTASALNTGQTINIRIANTDEDPAGVLNVLATWGALPYQGWIVKSNGTNWYIASRY